MEGKKIRTKTKNRASRIAECWVGCNANSPCDSSVKLLNTKNTELKVDILWNREGAKPCTYIALRQNNSTEANADTEKTRLFLGIPR